MNVIIDFGMGNLRSVQKAIEAVGAAAEITSDPERVRRASKVILPGVGAFADAMAELWCAQVSRASEFASACSFYSSAAARMANTPGSVCYPAASFASPLDRA
jgi:imidazoleglycerol phosphate synthase glutamine amidotransferase subunit HisH